jgi:hypothetical protein
MRWKFPSDLISPPPDISKLREWHPYFAIFPIKIGDTFVLFEHVERRFPNAAFNFAFNKLRLGEPQYRFKDEPPHV